MPTFAELRAKAETAASAARDKSHSLTFSKYSPATPPPSSARPPAPPVAARKPAFLSTASSSSSTSSLAPTRSPSYHAPPPVSSPAPPKRTVTSQRPAPQRAPPSSSPAQALSPSKPFSRYDEHDKHDMFAALDLFFTARIAPPAAQVAVPVSDPSELRPNVATAPPSTTSASEPAPPPVSLSTRPRLGPSASSSSSSSSFSTSVPTTPRRAASSRLEPTYPPHERYASAALTLGHWVLSDPFDADPTWFVSPLNPLPPPLRTRSDHQSSFSWTQRNDEKRFVGVSLFGDASIAWYRVLWSAMRERSDPGSVRFECTREARYRPRPDPWTDGARLYAAHVAYGPRLAEFAKDAVAQGVPVGRGECWDLANEGLTLISDEVRRSDPPAGGRGIPFPSIGRTHGHVVYWARVEAGDVVGTWYGGDPYVREGDVVEWREVKIKQVGMARGSYNLLGDPEHTAIIVETGDPSLLPTISPSSPSTRHLPSSLPSLTVIEQSLSHPPSRATYDLSAPESFERGEVWIYRPVPLREWVGVDKVEAIWPGEDGAEHVESWQVGELE